MTHPIGAGESRHYDGYTATRRHGEPDTVPLYDVWTHPGASTPAMDTAYRVGLVIGSHDTWASRPHVMPGVTPQEWRRHDSLDDAARYANDHYRDNDPDPIRSFLRFIDRTSDPLAMDTGRRRPHTAATATSPAPDVPSVSMRQIHQRVATMDSIRLYRRMTVPLDKGFARDTMRLPDVSAFMSSASHMLIHVDHRINRRTAMMFADADALTTYLSKEITTPDTIRDVDHHTTDDGIWAWFRKPDRVHSIHSDGTDVFVLHRPLTTSGLWQVRRIPSGNKTWFGQGLSYDEWSAWLTRVSLIVTENYSPYAALHQATEKAPELRRQIDSDAITDMDQVLDLIQRSLGQS